MISKEQGRNIAGQMLIEKYGREYLLKNKDKLSFIESTEGNKLHVSFTKHNHLEKITVEKNDGIHVSEDHFPDLLLEVTVNLANGEAKIQE